MPRRPNKRTSVAALDLHKIEDLAAKGLTLEQIAAALGIDVRTLWPCRIFYAQGPAAITASSRRSALPIR